MSTSLSNETRACLETLDAFMTALNHHDAEAMDACMHFPHVRLAAGAVQVWQRPGENPLALFERLRAEDGWARSAWVHRRLVQGDAAKMHFDVRYTRYRPDGSVIGTYDSLYVLTKQDGHWGIQARSSFGP